MAFSLIAFAVGCKKKEAPAVVEEVPAASAPAETDTSAKLAEEPTLKKVGEDSKAGVKNSPAHSAAAQEAGFSDHGSFVVQVSVFKGKRQAAGLVEKLANQGFPAYVAVVENPTPQLSGTWHRVRIGRFARIADAKSFGQNTLKPMGYDFWVDNKKNDKVGAGEGSMSSDEPAAPAAHASKKSKSAAAKTAAAASEEMPPPAPSVPTEPAPPAASSDSWGAPKPDEAAGSNASSPNATPPKTDEPAAPAGDSWGTPKTDQGSASGTSGSAAPAPTSSSESAAAPATPQGTKGAKGKAPGDTGKVNLDEW